LHPELINKKYAFYTRPMGGFIEIRGGEGIGWGLVEDIENAEIDKQVLIENRRYHTINELKNGQGPTPIKTKKGWIHLAHGVRNTAAGLRYVLYTFMTDLKKPWKIIHRPGGYLMAPEGEERVGDVSNVLFSNGWVAREDGSLLIYYASSDTRIHVAESNIEKMLDYIIHTPEDGLTSFASVELRKKLIEKNLNHTV
jgi:4-O-beta-D-mannosyl-D-glucose phosphorylase